MPLSISNLYSNHFSGSTSYNTSAVTTSNNSLLVVFVSAANSGTSWANNTLSISSSPSLTWTLQKFQASTTGVDWPVGSYIWTAPVTSGASTTVTISGVPSTSAFVAISVENATGYNTSTPVGATGSKDSNSAGALTNITFNLSASPASSSIIYSGTGTSVDGSSTGVTVGAGWTSLSGPATLNTLAVGAEYITGTTSTTVTWANIDVGDSYVGQNSAQVAIEILAPTSGPTTPSDCSFLYQPNANLNHPRSVDTNQPRDNMYSGWNTNPTSSKLNFWVQPPFLAPVPKTLDTNQSKNNMWGVTDGFVTSISYWLTSIPDLQRHVPTIYTAQSFVCNPTIGPPIPGWYTQSPDLLKHPNTVNTNQPVNDLFCGWNGTPTQFGFYKQTENLLKHPNPVDTNQSFKFNSPISTPGTPTLIQHVASSANPVGLGISGNNFKFYLPNAVGSGNCLVLAISYPNGNTPTVTDNNGNSWPGTPSVTADAGSGNYVASIFVLPNANAGVTAITVSFGAAIIPFEYTISEFSNVATVSPVNGTTFSASQAAPSLSTGAFTPGNNNANGGNLVYNYYALASPAGSNPTSWASGGSFNLLDADIAWVNNQGFPHASQYYVQATSASITPSITATGDTNHYNCVAVALKAASAGTSAPSGIHVNKLVHQTAIYPTSAPWSLQIPTTGNLLVIYTNFLASFVNITSVTDSDGGSWTRINPATDQPICYYSANRTPNLNLVVTLHGTNVGGSYTFWDISGAAASPYDTSVGVSGTDVSNLTTIANFPSITPSTSNGLVIAGSSLGQGPGLGFSSGAPSGAIFDLVNYTGETDLDLMENADLLAHIYNTSTATLNWNWLFTSQTSNTANSLSIAFKATSSSNPTPSDCSFLFQPNALLKHPNTIDTNQSFNSAFSGFTTNLTPTQFGFYKQTENLLKHPNTVDTNQPKTNFNSGFNNPTPTQFGFYKQPEDLLKHPNTVDTNQSFSWAFGGFINLTPSQFGFYVQFGLAPKLAPTINVTQSFVEQPPVVIPSTPSVGIAYRGFATSGIAAFGGWIPYTGGGGATTPSDCSFLFEPNALLKHPNTVDTNQSFDSAFSGFTTNLTPTQFGFYKQPENLLTHPNTVDTNQSFEFNPPPPTSTSKDCSFLFQPNALLKHPNTIDTNQSFNSAFSGFTTNLTPTQFGFYKQTENLLKHPNTVDTNQPKTNFNSGFNNPTPTHFGFYKQSEDLLKHPNTVDTNQSFSWAFSGFTINLTPTQLGFYKQTENLLKHPNTVDTNQSFEFNASNLTPTQFSFYKQPENLLTHPNTVDTNQSFEFNPPPPAITPKDCSFLYQSNVLLKHPNTIDTNQYNQLNFIETIKITYSIAIILGI